MSAYGNIAVTGGPVDLLPPTSWDLPPPPPGKLARPAPFHRLALHHLRLDGARCALPGLLEYTHRIFADEIEAGRTYPQEVDAAAVAAAGGDSDLGSQDAAAAAVLLRRGVDAEAGAGAHDYPYTRAAYEAYFWAADVFVAIGVGVDDAADVVGGGGGGDLDVEASRRGRKWEDVLVGFYYVKPNYPGRSSHVSAFFLHIDMHHNTSSHDGWSLLREVFSIDCDADRERKDLQCRFYDPSQSQAVRLWNDPGQVVLALCSLAWIQSERL
jgi:hypothetical protein